MGHSAREIHLVSRPSGEPTEDDFAVVERELPDPGEGQLLVRNVVMSVDPYMRGRMSDAKSYAAPYQLNEPLDGGAVGEVVSSGTGDVPEGALVLHGLGWRDHALVEARHARRVDPHLAAPSAYLGVLGMPGFTAYVGLLDVAEMKQGDVVFVSGAAGAVGSLVGQIAKQRGASRVIGSAGSQEKVDYLRDELGFDAAFNYKDAPVADQLATAAPDGVDVYFDNVGGDHLEAALDNMRLFGRIAFCGAISGYNATEAVPGPRNYRSVLVNRLTIRGFLQGDHMDRYADFQREMGAWVSDGRIKFVETVVDGLDHAVDAFLGLFHGQNTGKMIVKLTDN